MEEYLERIRSVFSERIDSYKLIQSGWTNIVIEINDQWIFRFVRDRANTQTAVECEFLPQFEKASPIKIPSLIKCDDDFIAYRKIIGERFDPEKFSLFSTIQKSEIIKLLGEFLTCLHEFQFAHPYLSEAPYGGDDFWTDLWPVVKDRLSARTRAKADRFFAQTLEQIHAVPFEKTITHSDLATNNILIDFEYRRLGGIIDFGDICFSDPARDFAGFYRRFGRSFVEELLHNYHRPVEENFWVRIEYEARRKIFFIVYFALNYGFERDIPDVLDYIETLFQNRT